MDTSLQPTILIVDDTAEFIDIVMNSLGAAYQFKVCMCGEDALELAEAEQPDLILLDIMMPNMDGYEVCERLKSNPATQAIPVIFLTVKNDVDDEYKGFKLGAVDYITKPISPPILQMRVKTQLEIKAARANLEIQNKNLEETAQLREDVERITHHDLKNPLAAILGSTDLMLLRGKYDKKMLGNIKTASYCILRMINHSLDLYKMEQRTYAYQPVTIDIHHIIETLLDEKSTMIQAGAYKVEVMLDDKSNHSQSSVSAQAEELLTYSMLSNLVQNALEASPANATVNIIIGENEHHAPYVSIQNTTTVPQHIRNTFFNKYITAGKQKGTGLGTYSAKLIAETQGGSIQMQILDETYTKITVTFSARIIHE